MGLNAGDIFRNTNNRIMDSAVIRQVFTSPINTAILIILVIVLIVAFYYRDYDGEYRYSNLVRIAMYGGIFTLVSIFIHNAVLLRNFQRRDENEDAKIIFGSGAHPLDKRQEIQTGGVTQLSDIPDLDIATNSSDSDDKSSSSSIDMAGTTTVNDLL